ncbi:RidA family protein [Enterococcus sp. CSURQ0835]|uniref:RidA family protein n=1 Tax=Enterococcus sp. CSURQ0835 TaxID=2681394 RepID=UPI00135C3354|nr:RidA family protein [Enterococcus sp. CSURQ0835]
MSKKMINSSQVPAPVGPFSHSVGTDDFLFISGQLGIDPATGKLPADVLAQAKQSFKNFDAILKEAGMTASDVVKTTVFLTDMNDFAAINEVYADYFGDWKPARSCYAVKSLPAGGDFEIEAIAAK